MNKLATALLIVLGILIYKSNTETTTDENKTTTDEKKATTDEKKTTTDLAAKFIADTSQSPQVSFFSTVTGGVAPYKYLWSFGVTGALTSNTAIASPVFIYPGKGTFSVTLVVSDSAATTVTVKKEITVYKKPIVSDPNSGFYSYQEYIDGELYTNNVTVNKLTGYEYHTLLPGNDIYAGTPFLVDMGIMMGAPGNLILGIVKSNYAQIDWGTRHWMNDVWASDTQARRYSISSALAAYSAVDRKNAGISPSGEYSYMNKIETPDIKIWEWRDRKLYHNGMPYMWVTPQKSRYTGQLILKYKMKRLQKEELAKGLFSVVFALAADPNKSFDYNVDGAIGLFGSNSSGEMDQFYLNTKTKTDAAAVSDKIKLLGDYIASFPSLYSVGQLYIYMEGMRGGESTQSKSGTVNLISFDNTRKLFKSNAYNEDPVKLGVIPAQYTMNAAILDDNYFQVTITISETWNALYDLHEA